MKFQKGDMVEVFKREPKSAVDWCVPQMDTFVKSGAYEIEDESLYYLCNGKKAHCYLLRSANAGSWWFPEHCLRLAKGYTPPTKQELVCIKIRQMYDKRKEAGYAF